MSESRRERSAGSPARGGRWWMLIAGASLALGILIVLDRAKAGPLALTAHILLSVLLVVLIPGCLLALLLHLWRGHLKRRRSPQRRRRLVVVTVVLLALAAVPVGLRGDDLVDGVLDAVQGSRTAHGVHLESVSRVRAFSIGRRRGLTEPSPLYRFRTDEGPLELRMKGPMPRQHPEEIVMVDGGELRYYPRTGIWVPTGS